MSSPEATDLNGDGVLDVVVGTSDGVIATDGGDGEVLWTSDRQKDVYTSAAFVDGNADEVDDVVMGGRSNDLVMYDGTSGEVLWSLRESQPDLPQSWFGMAKTVADVDGDGIPEVLVPQSGDDPGTRRDGTLRLVSGADGAQLSAIPTPDGNEIYSPPEVDESRPLDEQTLLIGTGGESIPGGVSAIRYAPDGASFATEWSSPGSGVVAGPARVRTGSGAEQILTTSWNGPVRMLDQDGNQVWASQTDGLSSAAQPVVLPGTDDTQSSVVAVLVEGDTFPPHGSNSVVMWFDAETGETQRTVELDGFSGSDPVLYDLDDDGSQELLVTPVDTDEAGIPTSRLVALDGATGEEIAGVAFAGFAVSTPLIADLDGDGLAELVHADGAAMTCYHLNAPVEPNAVVRSYQGPKGPETT
ncbi:MAG: PQQ-binding-like beta-propeller repeat protein [Microthrixaceae bacterium]|nr:PQQ-binding-like beta-propeller repeat protein [Microthrixaceae bacterium]